MSEQNGIKTATNRHNADVLRERNDHDAATVLAIVLALSSQGGAEAVEAQVRRTIWSDPANRLGIRQPSPTGWWASAMPR